MVMKQPKRRTREHGEPTNPRRKAKGGDDIFDDANRGRKEESGDDIFDDANRSGKEKSGDDIFDDGKVDKGRKAVMMLSMTHLGAAVL